MKKKHITWYTQLSFICLALFFTPGVAAADNHFLMATTTSTDNTGLLDYLSDYFTTDTGIKMKWTATGTGKALKLGQGCDVDILLVHAPNAEKAFIADGYGEKRIPVMVNDFVLIGPPKDPAGIKGMPVVDALKRIKNHKALFVSRGDNSGTHKKELSLWQAVADTLPDKEKWYIQSGQGMLATITITAERQAYTLTDRGTYIKYEHTAGKNKQLTIIIDGGQPLINQYSILTLSKKNCPDRNYASAQAFADWLTGEKAQALIGDFRLPGKQLFKPNAQKK